MSARLSERNSANQIRKKGPNKQRVAVACHDIAHRKHSIRVNRFEDTYSYIACATKP